MAKVAQRTFKRFMDRVLERPADERMFTNEQVLEYGEARARIARLEMANSPEDAWWATLSTEQRKAWHATAEKSRRRGYSAGGL